MKAGMNRVEDAECKCTPKTYALIMPLGKAAKQFSRFAQEDIFLTLSN
jgi:hypothetical protein